VTDDQRAVVADAVREAGGGPALVLVVIEQMEQAELDGAIVILGATVTRYPHDGRRRPRVPLAEAALGIYGWMVLTANGEEESRD
jgi:hypothetical protein